MKTKNLSLKNTLIILALLLSINNIITPTQTSYATLQPIELINKNRFDVMAKYIYAKFYNQKIESKWALNLYDEHLHIWNNRIEKYPSKDVINIHCAKKYDAKNGISDYTNAFHQLLDTIETNGIDPNKSVIPIDRNNVLMDGAHRVAACLLYDKNVPCEKFLNHCTKNTVSANFLQHNKTFVSTGLQTKYLDNMALEYCRLKKNIYVISVFPSAVGKHTEIQEILKKYGAIVYEKNILINQMPGSVNFIKTLYDGEAWVGNLKNNFSGARAKAPYCFPRDKNGPTRIFLFECDSLEKVKECKQKIRSIFNIGNDSIHINDTDQEALKIAQAVFNDNSLHFINHAQIKQFKNFEKFLPCYKQWLIKNNYDAECFCIDGSAILSAYGIRDCNDLDIIHHGYDQEVKKAPYTFIGSHNGHEMQYHSTTKDDLIFNPENHFYYKGLKFCSLDKIKEMKTKRNESKDKTDVASINQLINYKK